MPAISFEFFPPKNEEQEKQLFATLRDLKPLKPAYVSVTYGALGNTQVKTLDWVKKIKTEFGIRPVAHLTCVNATEKSVLEYVDALVAMGVSDVLALRGDKPDGVTDFVPPKNGFKNSRELVSFIKKNRPQIHLGVAGYPEGHPDYAAKGNLPAEDQYDKSKIDAGAEYLISQLFFNNDKFLAFRDRLQRLGVKVPIIPGLMPISSFKQVQRMMDKMLVKFPSKLKDDLEKHQNDPNAIRQIGIEQAVAQCRGLIAAGAGEIHFFVLNQSEPIKTILKELRI